MMKAGDQHHPSNGNDDFPVSELVMDFDDVRIIEPIAEAQLPMRGDIWWTAADFDGPAGYDGSDRMPFVILDESFEADQKWFGAVPAWPDCDLANEVDLILPADATTVEVPLRVQLRRQITLAWTQLEEKLGEVRDEGMTLIDEALAGEAGLEHFGVPYESEQDWRIESDRWASDLVAKLQAPYFAALQAVEEAVDAYSPNTAVEGSQLIELEARLAQRARQALEHEFSLAASRAPQMQVIDLSANRFQLSAVLWADAMRSVLELYVREAKEDWWGQVELIVQLKGGETLESGKFSGEPGSKVSFAEGKAITLGDLDLSGFAARLYKK